jgi:lysophospholipase L1-like esterase
MHQKTRRDIVIGCCITVLLFLLGETAVRAYVHGIQRRTLLDQWEVADPMLGWKPKLGFKQGGIEINNLGFRGPETSVQKPPGTFRIVALGDSTTFGHREAMLSAYPAQLEVALNGPAGSCERRYEVINAGVEGYSARHVLARLEKEVLPIAPDMVIIYVGWNDLFGRDPERRLPDVDRNSWFNRLLRESYLLKGATKIVFERIRPLQEAVTPERVARYQRFVPASFSEETRRIVATARAGGVQVALATLPSLLGAEDWEVSRAILHYPAFTARPELLRILWERYNQAIRQLAEEMDVPLLDLAQGVRSVRNGRTLFIDTLHFNTAGYHVVAEILLTGLARARLLPCPVTSADGPAPA